MKKEDNSRKLKVYPQFRGVRFHRIRHSDEILAHMMLYTEAGVEVFPNLNPDNISYAEDNDCDYRDNPDVLHIGCGKDPRFDEHAIRGNWDSACTLMAKALGLLHHFAWKKTIEDVRKEDRRGKAIKGQISWVLKSLYRSHGGNIKAEEEVAKWAEIAYWAEIDSARERRINNTNPLTTKTAVILLEKQKNDNLQWFKKMISETSEYEEYMRERAREVFRSKETNLKPYLFVHKRLGSMNCSTIETDNEEVSNVFREPEFDIDVMVIRKSNGHNAIMTNYRKHNKGLDLATVWQELKSRETRERADWVPVGEDCTLLLNGSKTHPNVLPSGLTLEEIAEIICAGLSEVGFIHQSMSRDVLEKELGGLSVK